MTSEGTPRWYAADRPVSPAPRTTTGYSALMPRPPRTLSSSFSQRHVDTAQEQADQEGYRGRDREQDDRDPGRGQHHHDRQAPEESRRAPGAEHRLPGGQPPFPPTQCEVVGAGS